MPSNITSDEILAVNNSSNSSISGNFQDLLQIDGIGRFLQNELNVSGVILDEENTQKIKILNDKITSMQLDYVKLNNKVIELKKEIWETWDSLYYVQKNLANFQQYSRRENIEISGIPEYYDANLEFTVVRILKKIGFPHISSYDIIACHRLKKLTKDKLANVILRFVNRKDADVSLVNRKHLKTRIPEMPNLYN